MSLLTNSLRAVGFISVHSGRQNSKLVFVRPRKDRTFERIVCEFVGKKNDAAVCWIGVSLTRLIPFKGLTEIFVVSEVASDHERGWTIIESNEDRCNWFRSVVEIAVPKLDEVAENFAKDLIQRCGESMDRAKACLAGIEDDTSVNTLLINVKTKATEDELRVTERIVEWPGVVQIANAQTTYELATLLVLQTLYKSRLPNPYDSKEMPLEKTNLMWEIQLVADSLMGQCQVGGESVPPYADKDKEKRTGII
jgi:hypothetical protein